MVPSPQPIHQRRRFGPLHTQMGGGGGGGGGEFVVRVLARDRSIQVRAGEYRKRRGGVDEIADRLRFAQDRRGCSDL